MTHPMTPLDRAREAARRAFLESNYGVDPDNYTADLIKALAAYEAALSAEGMVIVPRVASEEMRRAALFTPMFEGAERQYFSDLWAAMIAAALAPIPEGSEPSSE